MATYNNLIHKYKNDLNDKGLSPEVAKAFIFELCNESNVNLYLDMDNEVLPEIENRFEDGIKRTIDNVLSKPELQVDDPEFDAWCDRVINALEAAKKAI